MTRPITVIAFAGLLLAQSSGETRVDLFDKHGRRDGYLVINEKTGRIDQFDSQSRRQGYGTVTTPCSRDSGTSDTSNNQRSIYGGSKSGR